MNKNRTTFLIFFSLIYMGGFLLHPAVDPFYLKALQDGKTAYNKGSYEQAIDDFKIAEFGLLETKEYLPELYLFYALACFKLQKIDETRTIVNKLKTELDIKDPGRIPKTAEIENDVNLMLVVVEKYNNRDDKNGLKNLTSIIRFEQGFLKTLEYLKNNDLTGVEKEIEELMLINKKDSRIPYLQGVAAFKKKRYKKCIEYLNSVTGSIEPAFRDGVFYYLALANYFIKNYSLTLTYYQKIHNTEDRKKLNFIIRKVEEERKSSIQQSLRNFSLQNLEGLIRKLPGDPALGIHILNEAIEVHKTNPHSIQNIISIIHVCLKKPGTYNAEFIHTAVDYLEKNGAIKSAITVIEKSKFFESQVPDHIDIYYKLGRLYLEVGDLKNALQQMRKVKSLRSDYESVDSMIDKINNLIENKNTTRRQR
jgi:tetratricopeptide (TPR) repeat protein